MLPIISNGIAWNIDVPSVGRFHPDIPRKIVPKGLIEIDKKQKRVVHNMKGIPD
jgi:hypothetical protein